MKTRELFHDQRIDGKKYTDHNKQGMRLWDRFQKLAPAKTKMNLKVS
jgi:hypothetical protein